MIIDAHCHIANNKTNMPHSDVESVIKLMDEDGVDKVIGFLYGNTTLENNIDWLNYVKPYLNRIIPYAWLNPLSEKADEELKYCLDVLGFKGLKLHPLVDKFDLGDLNKMDKIMRVANERKLHVIVHCTSNEAFVDTAKVERLAQKYPDCLIQLAHMGAIYDGNKAIEVAKNNKNVILDTGIASMNCIRRAILQIPDKIVMGGDYPSYTFRNEMLKIKDACLLSGNKEAFELICGKNIEKFINL